ncbi:MAG: hypothetical protein PHR26_01295 [Candidatus ainarchaeum sp.]|nr:hypothetical protein [Candidatus ainarchaeum sp.]MDD3975840.1 hypothetical protein [Candidatus ainarchaeum sp.]
MIVETIQIFVILGVIIIFGSIITYININKKTKKEINQEQSTWKKIDLLNNKKKELEKQKKEISYKFSAKAIDSEAYSKAIKYVTEELEKIVEKIDQEVSKLTKIQNKNLSEEDELRFNNIKIKGNLSELENENKIYKEKINELEGFIKKISESENINIDESQKAREKYMINVINKYKEIINEKERKTISEMKNRINPTDISIKSIINKFSPIGYNYEKEYLKTLKKIYNYLNSEIEIVDNNLGILFWIDFSKILTEKICDQQNASVLLCSIMDGLKDDFATIEVVLLDNEKIHTFVKTKYKNMNYIFDLTQKVPFDTYKNEDDKKLLEEYKFKKYKIIRRIYSYNKYNYTDIQN